MKKPRRMLRACVQGLFLLQIASFAIPAFATLGPALTVDTRYDRRPISPNIYGMNFANPAVADAIALPVERWGGNIAEKYNWKLGSVNSSGDYFWENIADCFYFGDGCDNGNVPYYRAFIETARARGTQTIMQLPMLGYVAKDAPTDHPFTCSFPPALFPDQNAFDPFDPNCGSGVSSGGVRLDASPTTAHVAVGPAFSKDWIKKLKSLYGSASAGGVAYYSLGNEPGLWNETHRDAHPSPVTYDELYAKSRALALAVKQADPGAKVLAFSEWGWLNYFCSAADYAREFGCRPNSPDRAAHGGTPLADWLLQQFRNYEQINGRRLIDYFDLHYYRQGGDTADVTRSLWDPTFTDPSYIGAKIRLLPRMRELVASNYPGTRIALSEYNLSIPGKPRLNAIIQADTFGIFAREGLDLATRFEVQDDGNAQALQQIYDAFRLYRNYDGHGSRFGDTYVRSTSSNERKVSVYAALRGTDGKMTVAILNKTEAALFSTLTLQGMGALGKARVWRWTGNGIRKQADQFVVGYPVSYPAQSMTLYEFTVR